MRAAAILHYAAAATGVKLSLFLTLWCCLLVLPVNYTVRCHSLQSPLDWVL